MRTFSLRGGVLRFGAFELDLCAGELRKAGTRIKVPPQPFKVLTLLVSRPGELVSREQIRQEIWGDDTFVDVEQGLGACISRIRIVLSDNSRQPRYVETLPKRGYRFIASVEGLPRPRKRMLAVLPFDNLGADSHQDYFCEGLTEELITEVACLDPERLGVIARTSVLPYQRAQRDIREIARELSVDYVLEGSVRRQGERARITAQLVQVCDHSHLWARTYECSVEDVLDLQQKMARRIAEAINVKVEGGRAHSRHSNPEAYEAYLKGRFFWNKRTKTGVQSAIDFFQKAIALEPDYALAYSGLADAYQMLGSSYAASALPPRKAFPRARKAALRSLEIDDTLAEGHASLAAVLHGYAWDWKGALEEYERAIELNASYATAHQWYAESLVAIGRTDEALSEIRRAQQVDPLSAVVNATTAWILYFARRYEEAAEQCRRTLEIHPDFAPAHLYLGLVYEQTGRCDDALREFRRARKHSSGAPETVAAPGHTYAALGRRAEAEQVLTELGKLARRKYVSSYLAAKIHAALGRTDDAFYDLAKALEERSDWLLFLNVDPCLDPLRSDPRFGELQRSVKLVE